MNQTAQQNHKGISKLSRGTLARLHIAKKALGLSEDDYRDLLQRVCGVRSATLIEPDQVLELQRELRRIGWDGYLLRKDELPPLKYSDIEYRDGDTPTGAQLRMLEARFKNIRGFADFAPDLAFRKFLEKRCHVAHPKFLDLRTYEIALSAVKRLENERGVKKPY